MLPRIYCLFRYYTCRPDRKPRETIRAFAEEHREAQLAEAALDWLELNLEESQFSIDHFACEWQALDEVARTPDRLKIVERWLAVAQVYACALTVSFYTEDAEQEFAAAFKDIL